MWLILLENLKEQTAAVYKEGIDRETGLRIIEEQFETGDLTREVYQKAASNVWAYNNYKFIRLLNEKGYQKWLAAKTTT